MMANLGRIWASLLLVASLGLGCDEIKDATEQVLDGEEAELKENDLPNCSKILTCCANLKGKSITPDAVNEQCDEIFVPAANEVIDNYQSIKDEIEAGTRGDQTVEQWKTTSQDTLEPGCRCFLENTVGVISDVALPADCEANTDTGALGAQTCDDATTELTNSASDDGN